MGWWLFFCLVYGVIFCSFFGFVLFLFFLQEEDMMLKYPVLL